MAEEGKKYSQLIKLKTFSDSALIAVDNNNAELNTISFEDFKNNKLSPLYALKTEVVDKIGIDNILQGDNIELVKENGNVTISALPPEPQPDPAVLAALQYINGSEVLKDEIIIENINKQGGSINLQTNNIYKIDLLNQNTNFIPPTTEQLNTQIHNQIGIFFTYNKLENLEEKPTIDFGENVQFVNGLTVDFEIGKNYRAYYEYNPIQNIWVVGIIMNQETIY